MASAVNVATLTPTKCEPYMDPQNARTVALEFWPSQTIAKGTLLGQRTATGLAGAYNDSKTDGTQAAKYIAVYDMVVDADGYVIYGPSGAAADLTRGRDKTGEAYWKGTFLETDLTGFDAAALADFGGREIGNGSLKCVVLG